MSHRLRAPRENHAIFAEPPLSEVGALLAENQRRFQQPFHIFGIPWPELRRRAMEEALSAARSYLQAAGEPIPDIQGDRLLLAGHQPELFHPGVWIKNFALAGLARKHGAVPLNLVVDSDTAKSAHSTKLFVPEGDHLAAIPMDRWQADEPYEERRVLDEELFRSVPERVAPHTNAWPFKPMLAEFWQEVRRQGQRSPLLGERLAAARRTWERRWGCHNLEVPLSKLCQTETFARFACHLLHDLPRFHTIYNQAVHAYRRAHGIRSRNHPVPDLASDGGDWLEAPFWIWVHGKTRRERLFARLSGSTLHLRCGSDIEASIDLAPDRAVSQTIAQWLDLERQRIKIRTRALTTTTFARLLLGETFLHGIGGAKYDELTDAIIQQFYGIEPPRYLVLSATLLLPMPHPPLTVDEVRRLEQTRRDSWWNPQRHFQGPTIEALAWLKQSWIDRPCTGKEDRRERFRQLRDFTEQLRGLAANDFRQQSALLTDAKHQLAVNQVLGRREYAFCLFPEEELRPFVSSVLH